MHLLSVELHAERYPTSEHYPFNLAALRDTPEVPFTTPVTLFVGENGAGKSTLLRAIAARCGIHIWRETGRRRVAHSPYEGRLGECLSVEWADGPVPGSFFGSETFRDFATALDDFASSDPGQLRYFGGKSLLTQSHGQSMMAFFAARYAVRGLHLLDEPETALSARTQLALLRLLIEMGGAGHAQFVVATHSPILLACPGAAIYSFDGERVQPIRYEDTDHYRVFRDFMADPAGSVARLME